MTALARHEQTNSAVIEHPANAVAQPDPFLAMIERAASNPDFDIVKMQALVDMRNAELARQARVAFDSAFAEMQPKLPVIDRNGRIEIRKKDKDGERTGDVQQSSAYALWADIKDACNPFMLEHGFGISFRPKTAPDGKIVVNCILSHRGGHREEADSIPMQHDSTGSKNAVQAVGSSLSYGIRYMGIMMLGIVSKEGDDDGKKAGAAQYITEDQVRELEILLGQTQSNTEQFLKFCKVESLETMPRDKFKTAKDRLIAKRDGVAQ